MTKRIGLVGGSGLYSLPGLVVERETAVATPFGEPSDAYVLGAIGGVPVAFLARHGRGHRLLPSEVNYRANVWGFRRRSSKRPNKKRSSDVLSNRLPMADCCSKWRGAVSGSAILLGIYRRANERGHNGRRTWHTRRT